MDTNALARLLRDGAQGASNAVASNVSAPVDALAWALRKGGLPIPANPVGGSDWMFEKGLMAQPQNKLAGLVGETAGLLGPVVVAAKAPQLAGGLLGMFDNISTPATLNRQAGVVEFQNWGKKVKPLPLGSGELPSHAMLTPMPNKAAARATENFDIGVGLLADGRFQARYLPQWGNKGKAFIATGDNLDELVNASIQRAKNSVRGSSAAAAAKENASTVGVLKKEFGDVFQTSRSARSESEYITHVPSGTKIRISDHALPLGYVQPDLNFPKSATPEQIAQALKRFFEN